ncbi:hypothetical protein BH09VER1_BH09VER1_52600 [soil metagenome]
MRLPFILVLLFAQIGWADESLSPALSLLCTTSDIIVVATLETLPVGYQGSAPIAPTPGQFYPQDSLPCRIHIEKVLMGKAPANLSPLLSLTAAIILTPLTRDADTASTAGLTKGSRWIMFLKSRRLHPELGHMGTEADPVDLLAFDPWLSFQPYSKSLEMVIGSPGMGGTLLLRQQLQGPVSKLLHP